MWQCIFEIGAGFTDVARLKNIKVKSESFLNNLQTLKRRIYGKSNRSNGYYTS